MQLVGAFVIIRVGALRVLLPEGLAVGLGRSGLGVTEGAELTGPGRRSGVGRVQDQPQSCGLGTRCTVMPLSEGGRAERQGARRGWGKRAEDSVAVWGPLDIQVDMLDREFV